MTDSELATGASERPRHGARWAALGVAALLAAFVGVLATREPAATREADSPLLGQPAPEVSGRGLDGRPFRLSSMRGRFVVVNFFATWCVPCRKEHPELVRFQNLHLAKGDATLVSVIYDDDIATVRRFFAKKGGDWPVIDAASAKVAFGVRGVPESFVVDPQGFVVARVVGGVKAESLDAIVNRTAR